MVKGLKPFTFHICFFKTFTFSFLLFFTGAIAQSQDEGRSGNIDGVQVWTLPDAPSGTEPDQCWHAVGSAPNGDIYISGHDHVTNSMLYQLDQSDDILRWVGDARQASQDAGNWESGESAQKFHCRPIWYEGDVYVATADRTTINDAFYSSRGFHWYKYDVDADRFIDLSADEPGGVAVEHMQIVTIQPDPATDVMYGADIPRMEIVSYDINQGVTTELGRPSQWDQYIYSNRFMWVDSRSRLYITAGSERGQWNQGEPQDVFDNVWYYDPSSGFGKLESFDLQGANAIEVGQWNREHTRCYMSDDQGHIYRFEDEGPSFTYLGRPDFSTSYKVWIIHVSPDEKKIYIARGDNDKAIHEYDIESGESHELSSLGDLDNTANNRAFITGYDAWDRDGNFYFSSFSMNDGRNTMLVGVNPVKVKVNKGILSSLIEVEVSSDQDNNIIMTRSGGTDGSLEVLYEVAGLDQSGDNLFTVYGKATIQDGGESVSISPADISVPYTDGVDNLVFYVMPDGNDYIAGTERSVSVSGAAPVKKAGFVSKESSLIVNHLSASKNIHNFMLNIPSNSFVSLRIYDSRGRMLGRPVNRQMNAGEHRISWKSEGSMSGLFFAVMKAGEKRVTSRMIAF